jgi:hypothetical protein
MADPVCVISLLMIRCRGRGRRSGNMVVAARWLRMNRINTKTKKNKTKHHYSLQYNDQNYNSRISRIK